MSLLRAAGIAFGMMLGTILGPATGWEGPWTRGKTEPLWSGIRPVRVIPFPYRRGETPAANGRRLTQAMQQLRPGDRLEIASGRYVLAARFTLDLQGTRDAPIWIVGRDPRHPPRIERLDAGQNLINLGERRPTRYLALRHLELKGGSVAIRFYGCSDVWLDQCELHHAAHGGITANSRNTRRLFITRNHLHDFHGGTGEAMYLGANHGQVVMRDSVIAGNHVHDCGGEQGDGIELKQGSFGNWIVSNHIHDTNYPCLIVYGTGGKGINVIERNICYRSRDNVMQVQGEAIVRNNLIMSARGAGFASTDHQGKTRALTVLHNTIITEGVGANLSSWNGRAEMVFANNAVYSRHRAAIRFPHGSAGVAVAGNVVLGGVEGARRGSVPGRGLEDFRSVRWDARRRQAAPAPGSPLLGAADPRFPVPHDLTGRPRHSKTTAGALESTRQRQRG